MSRNAHKAVIVCFSVHKPIIVHFKDNWLNSKDIILPGCICTALRLSPISNEAKTDKMRKEHEGEHDVPRRRNT